MGTRRCGAGGCGQVQPSRYADLWGVPVAFYGVVGYAALLEVAVLGLRPGLLAERGVTLALAAPATVGVAFSLERTYLELLGIHSVWRRSAGSAGSVAGISVRALAPERS